MRELPMTPEAKVAARTTAACPYCDRQMDDPRSRIWWRRIQTLVLYGWIVGLGILGAEIVIEAQMISRQWELFDRTVKLLELKAQMARR